LSGKSVYEETVDVWLSERSSREPAPISDDWLKRLRGYAEELRIRIKLATDRSSIHFKLCEKELDVLTTLVSNIFQLRLEKIVLAAMRGESIGNLIPAEKRLYESLTKPLTIYREYIQYCTDSLDFSKQMVESIDSVIVVFVKEAPAIVDSDGITRGPFPVGSIASLDHKTAELLERGGFVRRLPLIRG